MNPRRPALAKPGFTLIELLVVTGILSVILTLTAAISSQAIDLRSATKARIVAERNAAAFMRQFESDLNQRVLHREARIRVLKQTGNDEIELLTQRPGLSVLIEKADRRAALVSYRIKRQMLERAASGYGFGTPDVRPDEKAGTLALARVPAEGPERPDERAYQVIAPGVIRLEYCFLVREDEKLVVRMQPPEDQETIEAVIATVVTLDPDRSRMLDDRKFGLIAAEFPDAVDYELPAGKWNVIAARLASRLPGLPKAAVEQVRVQQGIFALPNRKSSS